MENEGSGFYPTLKWQTEKGDDYNDEVYYNISRPVSSEVEHRVYTGGRGFNSHAGHNFIDLIVILHMNKV